MANNNDARNQVPTQWGDVRTSAYPALQRWLNDTHENPERTRLERAAASELVALGHERDGDHIEALLAASRAYEILMLEPPLAIAQLRMDRTGYEYLCVRECPFCSKRHNHSREGGYGLRMSHCDRDAQNYKLVAPRHERAS